MSQANVLQFIAQNNFFTPNIAITSYFFNIVHDSGMENAVFFN